MDQLRSDTLFADTKLAKQLCLFDIEHA